MRLIHALMAAALLLGGLAALVQAQSSCFGLTYVVRAGESLFSIAERCDIPYAALVGINVEIRDPNRIFPGQVIRLVASVPLDSAPAGGPPDHGGLQEGGQVYIARRGDSLGRIAYLYNTTVAELRLYNPNIGDNNVIYVGQRIQMPPDARREKGWVGVNTRVAAPGDDVEVRVVDFPPYADIDIHLGERFEWDDGEIEIYYYVTIDGRTDSRGQARISVTIPFYAWIEEEWIVEVVTSEQSPGARGLSPIILIDYD